MNACMHLLIISIGWFLIAPRKTMRQSIDGACCLLFIHACHGRGVRGRIFRPKNLWQTGGGSWTIVDEELTYLIPVPDTQYLIVENNDFFFFFFSLFSDKYLKPWRHRFIGLHLKKKFSRGQAFFVRGVELLQSLLWEKRRRKCWVHP